MKHTGSCLCGTVRWEIDGPLSDVAHCHCGMCRKVHGTPFATYADAHPSSLRWLSGESAISSYASSTDTVRRFCSQCGSVVPETQGDSLLFVPLGGMDGANLPEPTAHIFVGSGASWYTISDTLPQHEAYAPGVSAVPVTHPARVPAACVPAAAEVPGTGRGSCLCGAVSYQVRLPLSRVYYCHCSRCRKARSAAYASNGFTSAENLTFSTGADQLKDFKVADARFFTQVFCKTCGSPMPRVDRDRDIAAIPLGSLDDDPGRAPDVHIFVASKAPWFTITDDIVQYSESL